MSITNIAILGASGYVGAELIRLLLPRRDVRLVALSAERQAGQNIETVWPHLRGYDLPTLRKIDALDFSDVAFVFCALPHATTQEVVARLPSQIRVVDLSADFRLADPSVYEKWYGGKHNALNLQKEAVYGLTELHRTAIQKARLVANPGCYPTAAQLALVPLIEAGAVVADRIVIDAKSGLSGAGRDAKIGALYTEAGEGFQAYGIASHRHTPEIDQGLSWAAGRPVEASFTPHLLPMSRGILETIYVDLAPGRDAAALRALWQERYGAEPFIRILPPGVFPATQHVRGTNLCQLAVADDRITGRAIIVAAIDNLVKGAAGQAVQNMNLMLGIPETEGLVQMALFP